MPFKKNTHGGPIGSGAPAKTSTTPHRSSPSSSTSTPHTSSSSGSTPPTTTTTTESTATPDGVRKDLVPVGFLYGSRVVNVILAMITHALIAAAIFTGVARFLPDEIVFEGINLLMSVGISAALYLYCWTTKVRVGTAVTLTFWGSLTTAWLVDFRWWTPFWLFSATEHDTKPDPVEIPGFSSMSAKVKKNGETLEQVPVTFGKCTLYWVPSGPRFALQDRETVRRGFLTAVDSDLRSLATEESSQYLISSGPLFEDKIRGTKDMRSRCERQDVTVQKIDIGQISFSPEYTAALQKAAVERAECDAEDIEMRHVNHMISEIAAGLVTAGMNKRDAAEKAAIIYQNQQGHALGINFMGGGGKTGDFTSAAAINIAENRRAAKGAKS